MGSPLDPMFLAERLGLALLLGVFLGLAFEDVYKRGDRRAPGGIRTFPLLALAGAMLLLLEPAHASAVTVGLLVVGAWLYAYVRATLHGNPPASTLAGGMTPTLIVPVSSLTAYLLGPVSLTQPPWVAVALAVSAALLLGARERLHALVHVVPSEEVLTAGKFLVLIGVVLPLVPNEPVLAGVPVTPYQAWMAVVAVCALSYGSYLVQRYAPLRHGTLVPAVLGGLYSSTAATVVLARRLAEPGAPTHELSAGIVAATAMMYLRLGLIVALFNAPVVRVLALPLVGLIIVGALAAAALWRPAPQTAERKALPVTNPLQVNAAIVFAALFIVVAVASRWAQATFGEAGIVALSAVVGVTDIDPFVLSVIQGSVPGLAPESVAAAILIASSTNNLAKAAYAAAFGGWAVARRPALVLGALAVLGLGAAALLTR
ncbi:MgtC/SapB family protein [Azospirillum sp. sgz301742]